MLCSCIHIMWKWVFIVSTFLHDLLNDPSFKMEFEKEALSISQFVSKLIPKPKVTSILVTRPLLRPETKLQSHFHQKHVFCNFPVNDSAHVARCWHLTRCSRGWAKNSCAECLFIMFFGIICTLTPYSTIYGWQFFKKHFPEWCSSPTSWKKWQQWAVWMYCFYTVAPPVPGALLRTQWLTRGGYKARSAGRPALSSRPPRDQHHTRTMAPKIKLTYFALRGRAEPSRLLLAYAGMEYEDCRIVPGFED